MNSKDKKKVLKKYTGKGGPYTAADIRQINQNDMMKPKLDMSKAPSPIHALGGMAKRVASDVVGGAKKVAGSVIGSYTSKFKAVDAARKAQDDKYRADGDALKSGAAKMGVLKKIVGAPSPMVEKLPKKVPAMLPKKMAPAGAPLADLKPKIK